MHTTSGIDLMAKQMGGGANAATQTGIGTTAPTATTITLDGLGAPGSTTAYNGQLITCGGGYGVVLSNTNAAPPVLTIDRWYDPNNPGGNALATPAAGRWILLPGGAPGWWMALSTDAGAPSAGDTTLASELTTNGFARALCTYAHTNGQSTFTLSKTFTSTQGSGSTDIAKAAFFNAQNGGTMPYETLLPAHAVLALADTVTPTDTFTLT